MLRFQKYLARLGFSCTVITASNVQSREGVDIVFVPDELAAVWNSARSGRLSASAHVERVLRKIVLPGGFGFIWSVEAAKHARRVIEKQGSDRAVLLTSFPPVGVLLAGFMVLLRKQVRWIADFRDPLGAPEVALRFPPVARFCFRVLERWTFRAATVIIANTEPAAAWLRRRYPDARSKLKVIPNGFDPETRPRPLPIPPETPKTLLHAGQLYFGRNADAILFSLARLRAQNFPEALEVKLRFIGEVTWKNNKNQSLYEQAQREGWVELLPPVTKEEAVRLTCEAHGLLLLQPQSASQVPAKIYEYLCVGRPILALIPRHSAVEQILSKSGVPYVCVYPDGEPEETDRAVLEYLRLPSAPAPYSEWFSGEFDGSRQAAELASIIRDMQWPGDTPDLQNVK